METSLDEIKKSINSQINNKFPGNDGLKEVFYNTFKAPGERLAP